MKREHELRLEFNRNLALLIEAIEEHIRPLQLNKKLHFIAEQFKFIHSTVENEMFDYVLKEHIFGLIPYYHKEVSRIISKKWNKRVLFYIEKDKFEKYLISVKNHLELAPPSTNPNDNDFQQYEFGYIKDGTLHWTADKDQFALVFFGIKDVFELKSQKAPTLSTHVRTLCNDGCLKFPTAYNYETFKAYFTRLIEHQVKKQKAKSEPITPKIQVLQAKEVLTKFFRSQ